METPVSALSFAITPRSHRPRVLLAEDDPELRTLVASALRHDDYDVTTVADGGRLLVHLAESWSGADAAASYDLLVTDLRMPVMNGLHLLETLRLVGWRAPAIVMTAFGDEVTRRRIEAQRAIMFSKPFDLDDLRTAVLHVLRWASKGTTARPSLARVASFATWRAAHEAKQWLAVASIHALLAGGQTGPVALFVVSREEDRVRRLLYGQPLG